MRVEPYGPRDAEFIIVGEAPGAEEYRQGRPFVGPSGELIRNTLKEVGLDPEAIYWTNVVKEYRRGNPTPSTEEINEALPELVAELKAHPAKHVLLVGGTALQALTGKRGGITKVQGTLQEPRKQAAELADKHLIPVVHPAYVLRNRNRATESEFLSVIGAFAHLGKPEEEVEIEWVGEPMDCGALEDDLIDHDRAAIDIEATPYPWWHEKHQLVSAAITFDGHKAYVLDLRPGWGFGSEKYGYNGWLGAWLPQVGKWVMHNGKYDRQVLLAQGIDLTLGFDTMTAQYLIDPNQKKSLEFLSGIHLGLAPYKDVDYKNILEEPIKKVGRMNANDAVRTWRLYEDVYKPKIGADPRLNRLFQFLMIPAINALVELELGGIPIDVDRLEDLAEGLEADLARHTELLAVYAGKPDLNPNSPVQMRRFLYRDLGLPVVSRTTKTKKPALDKDTRAALMPMHPAIRVYDDYKTVSQSITAFINPWREMERDGRLHTSYKPSHVVTGRLSSEKPNFQQVPRDPRFRRLFGGVPGHKVIELDYSQIELRIAAWLADEYEMLRAYSVGEDLHTLTAERVIGDPAARQTGKTLNFGLLYGAGAKKLQKIALGDYGVEMTLPEAEQYHRDFFETYPGLKSWQNMTKAKVHTQKFLDSPIGRRRYFPNIDSMDFGKRIHEENAALNHPVQSMASDLMLFSLTELHRSGFRIFATIHDSVLLLAPADEAEGHALKAKEVMESIPQHIKRKFGVSIAVPIVADYSIGDYWYE